MTPTADTGISRLPVDPDVGSGAPGAIGATGDDVERAVQPRPHARAAQGIVVMSLACGGVLGAVSRYAISLALPAASGQFPWGTFLINASGSFVLGFLLVLLMEQFPRGRLARPVIGTGFLGAYTTFSTFMVDAVELVHDGSIGTAAAYVLASIAAGLVAAWLGMTTARVAVRTERWLQEHAA